MGSSILASVFGLFLIRLGAGTAYGSSEDSLRDQRMVSDCWALYEAYNNDPTIVEKLRVAEISCSGMVVDSGKGINVETGQIVDISNGHPAAYVEGTARSILLLNPGQVNERPFKLDVPIAVSKRWKLAEPENRAEFSTFRGNFQGVALCLFAEDDMWKAAKITKFPTTFLLTLPLIEDFKKFVTSGSLEEAVAASGAALGPFQLCAWAEVFQTVPKGDDVEKAIKAQKGFNSK